MKISISNIAWEKENDIHIYEHLKKNNFAGIEVAPTKIIIENPYNETQKAKEFSNKLKKDYDFVISSMQSIWYGKTENIFGSLNERKELIDYTKKAIDFANAIECGNLVMGCSKNRIMKNKEDMKIAILFFEELGEYAKIKNTILSIEPNPIIYNTNFINYTAEAFDLVKKVKSDGFKVNVDLGTIIYNKEDLKQIEDNINLVNHIHISEPNLALIKKRKEHKQLAKILNENEYNKFISIEMARRDNIREVEETIEYIRDMFN